jgi:hypothetical protein
MKKLNILTVGILTAAMVSNASADVTMNFTGSTAFRSAIHNAAKAALTGCTYAYAGTSLGSAGSAIFKGTISGHSELGTVTIRTSWSGSGTGVRDVAANNGAGNPILFISGTSATSSGGTQNAVATESAVAHVALSDVFQSSTGFTGGSYKTLTNTNVGVVPFVFVANDSTLISGANAGKLTNVTPQLFQALFVNGSQPLSLFTGDVNDTALVYSTGRDTGSGTRITTLAETGYGINKPVQQWKVTVSGTNADQLDSLQIWPTTGSGADAANAGNGGFTSGGNVASALSAKSTNVTTLDADGATINTGENLLLIGYVGTADATTAVGNGAKQLKYAGVDYSANNVFNGFYTFWAYEHMYSATLTTNENTIKNAVVAQIPSNLGTAGLDINSMAVGRSNDGGLVGP